MIKAIFLSLIILFTSNALGQADFSQLDERSKSVPDSLDSETAIAAYLCQGLESDTAKARALYTWLAYNINYDLRQAGSNRRFQDPKELIVEALQRRKGVCQHFSELFHAMGRSVGLETFVIGGYTRNPNGDIAELNHAWNAIKVDTNYYLLDVTWASGYERNGRYYNEFRDEYFLVQPGDFIRTHMPFDPIWQFLEQPLTHIDFIKGEFDQTERKAHFAYRDSIPQYLAQNEIARLESSRRRISKSGIRHRLIRQQVEQTEYRITSLKYNRAIDTLQYGIDHYNIYVGHKNKQFRNPKISDERIIDLIEKARNGVYSAKHLLSNLKSTESELQRLITDARKRMPGMIRDLKREEEFVENYLKKGKLFRPFLFYHMGP